ncbi:MAG: hypothetical protein U0237_07105 [Thermoleophilia bacterium]
MRGARRRAVTVAVACGVVIVLVAAAVFSIGSRSRAVVRHAGDLHAVNESLRAITVVRSQVGFAAFLASVDERYRTDSGDIIRTAVIDARRGLSDTRSTLEAADPASPLGADQPQELVGEFAGQGERVIRLIEAGDAARARNATADLDASFDRARQELVRRRDAQLALLSSDDDSLWRLGLLASFVVAFVVPAGVVLLYLSLTRRPRREVHEELDALQRRRLRTRRVAAAEAAIVSLREVIRRGDGGSALATLDDLEVLLRVAGDHAGQRFADTALRPVLDEVAASARGPSGAPEVHCEDERAWTDPEGLRHLLGNLLRQVAATGGREPRLVCTRSGGNLQLAVAYRGAAPGADVEVLLGQGSWADDAAPPPHLLTAAALAEGMGARIGVLRDPVPAFAVQLEESAPEAVPAPAPPGPVPA